MCDLLVSLPRLWREPPAREKFVVTDATLDSSSVVCTVGQRVAMFAAKWPVVVIHMPLAEAGAINAMISVSHHCRADRLERCGDCACAFVD